MVGMQIAFRPTRCLLYAQLKIRSAPLGPRLSYTIIIPLHIQGTGIERKKLPGRMVAQLHHEISYDAVNKEKTATKGGDLY